MTNPAIIQVKGISVSYDRKRVLSNIFLEIHSGELVGVIGPNGAGKSTLIKAILGLVDQYSGNIKVHNGSVKRVRKRIAYVPQKNDVDWQFPATVMDIILMGRYPHVGFFSGLTKKDKRIATEALLEVGMENYRDRQIGELSGGQQQRIFLARALAQKADIFFLDEPFVGVDIVTEKKIISILKKLASQNKTIMVIHHDLSSVKDYFNNVILLNQRLIAYGPTSEIFTEENIQLTYGGQQPILHKIGMLDK